MTLIIKMKINLKEIYFSYIKIPKIFFFILIVSFNMLFFNFCLAENSNLNPNSETEITIKPKANKYSKWPEASYKRIYVMENMAPLPFKKFPYKPIYNGDINNETLEESKKIKDSAINQISFKFNLQEQKEKERKRNKKEMVAFNEKKNKNFFKYFKTLKKIRMKPANYSGFHYDYSNYLQNFQIITKR